MRAWNYHEQKLFNAIKFIGQVLKEEIDIFVIDNLRKFEKISDEN